MAFTKVSSSLLADNSVTSAKFADGAVTSTKLQMVQLLQLK